MRRQSGVTLLELLVALNLFVLIAAMAYTGLSFLRRSAADVQRQLDRTEEIVFAQARLRELIGGVAAPDPSGQAPISGGDTEIRVRSTANPVFRGIATLTTLRVNRDQEALSLSVRPDWMSTSTANVTVPDRVLLSGVSRMRIEYKNASGEWQDGWMEGTTPAAVRVHVTLAEGDEDVWPLFVVAVPALAPVYCEFDVVSRRCRG